MVMWLYLKGLKTLNNMIWLQFCKQFPQGDFYCLSQITEVNLKASYQNSFSQKY